MTEKRGVDGFEIGRQVGEMGRYSIINRNVKAAERILQEQKDSLSPEIYDYIEFSRDILKNQVQDYLNRTGDKEEDLV